MKILRLKDASLREAVLETAGMLARGGIVLFPTDTLYGLAVDAHNPVALARLRALKGRETKKPISVILSSVDSIGEYVEYGPSARKLAERHLPGALTLVLPATRNAPADVQLLGTLGVRVPEHQFSLMLAQEFGRAYTATSANRSGFPTRNSVEHILQDFGPAISEIDLVVDDGELAAGIGSTVVTVRDGTVLVLREGKISREELGL